MIFQCGSTLKVSIELPATSRHRRDMTERLLKATLSPNQTNKRFSWKNKKSIIDFSSAEFAQGVVNPAGTWH